MLRNILAQLKVRCRFAPGCEKVISPAELPTHELNCLKDPNATQICARGCGLLLTNQELPDHDCLTAAVEEIERLRSLVSVQLSEGTPPNYACYDIDSQSQLQVNDLITSGQFAAYDHAWGIKYRRLKSDGFEFSLICYGPVDVKAAAAEAGMSVSAAHRWKFQLNAEIKLKLQSSERSSAKR